MKGIFRHEVQGVALFRSERAAQLWAMQKILWNDRINYLVGFRDCGDHGRSYGISFGHAGWVTPGTKYVRDIFPKVVH